MDCAKYKETWFLPLSSTRTKTLNFVVVIVTLVWLHFPYSPSTTCTFVVRKISITRTVMRKKCTQAMLVSENVCFRVRAHEDTTQWILSSTYTTNVGPSTSNTRPCRSPNPRAVVASWKNCVRRVDGATVPRKRVNDKYSQAPWVFGSSWSRAPLHCSDRLYQ